MPDRRILAIWFPRLGAERVLRLGAAPNGEPLAVVGSLGNSQVLTSLSAAAEAEGLRRGQPLRDALAVCPGLVTRHAEPKGELALLIALRRWARKYSPLVTESRPDTLMIDLTGTAHLFGGEEALALRIDDETADLGLSAHLGIADTPSAAWAMAHYGGRPLVPARSGDAIDQEAPATRARAARRRNWERGGPAPRLTGPQAGAARIAPVGGTRGAVAGLPIAALRLPPETELVLDRLGLRRIGDLVGAPRASLARRFGQIVVTRLDQILGVEPEPISPAGVELHFAIRLSLPDPVGLESDILAGIDRLLPGLTGKLKAHGQGARQVRLQMFRVDQSVISVTVGLARQTADGDRIRRLLAMKIKGLDAGFGIDMLRLEATETEPLEQQQRRVQFEIGAGRDEGAGDPGSANPAIDDLISKIGARIGLESVLRMHPGQSHLPEKSSLMFAAAWSRPVMDWTRPATPRPLVLWRPGIVTAAAGPQLPHDFRWQRRTLAVAGGLGPERICAEWWLDDPDWRTGIRDYWRVTTAGGEALWLYHAHGGALSGGWFCHGAFA